MQHLIKMERKKGHGGKVLFVIGSNVINERPKRKNFLSAPGKRKKFSSSAKFDRKT